MNHFKKMLERANLQNISYLFQMGCIKNELNHKDLEEREDEAVQVLEQRIKKCVPEAFFHELTDIAMEYANDCSEIYFTLGMKAGAKLMFQLLNDSLDDN